jgi:excisionase family DNA binding protein
MSRLKRKIQRRKKNAATTSIPDAAERLGIGRNQAYEAVKRGEIPIIPIGRRKLVPTAWLERVLNGASA